MQTRDFWTKIASLYGSQNSPVIVCNAKQRGLASELLVSMGPSPQLWFLHAKQRLLDMNNKSLRVPDISCRFVQAIQRD